MEAVFQAKNSTNTRLLHDLVYLIRQHTHVCLGFSFLFLWTWIFFQDSFVYTPGNSGAEYGIFNPWNICIFAFVAVFMIIGAASRSVDFNFRNKKVLILVALAMLLGAGVLNFTAITGIAIDRAAVILAAVVLGAASPLFYIEYARTYLRFNLKEIIMIGVVATVCTSLIYLTLPLMPEIATSVFTFFIPVVLLVCMLVSCKKDTVVYMRERTIRKKIYIPWKLNLTAFFHGMSFGAGRWFLVYSESSGWLTESHGTMYVVGYIVAAIALVTMVTYLKSNFDKLIYKIGFLCIAIGLILLLSPSLRQLGCFVTAFGFRFADLLIWTLVIYLAVSKKVTINWLAGWPTAFLYFGMFAGYFVINFAFSSNFIHPEIAVTAVSLVILMAALIMTSSINETNAWGSIRPSDDLISSMYFEETLDRIALHANITERQKNVLALLATGCSKKDIAKELFLSEETVKTHTRNVYRKLSVHSQQELIALVEAEEENYSETVWNNMES